MKDLFEVFVVMFLFSLLVAGIAIGFLLINPITWVFVVLWKIFQ